MGFKSNLKMTESFNILSDFAEGKITAKDFEQELYNNIQLQEILSDETINWSGTYLEHTNPFLFLAEQNFNHSDGLLNAQKTVELFLEKKNIKINPTEKHAENYDFLLSSVPNYLDLKSDFFEKYILSYDSSLSKTETKKLIKHKIDELFKYQSKPPRWIQNPEWIIKNNRPLFFLHQVEIKNCEHFHDDGFIYLFVNQETKEIGTVTQFY